MKIKTYLTALLIAALGMNTATVYAQTPTTNTTSEVVGNILYIDDNQKLSVEAEFTYPTLEACWADAVEANAGLRGTGYLAVCWPNIVDAI